MATPPKPKDNTPVPDKWVRFTDEKGSGWARVGPGGNTTYEKRYDPPARASTANPLETDTPALDAVTNHKKHGIVRYTTKGGTVLEAEVRELPNGQFQLYDPVRKQPLRTFQNQAEMERYAQVRQDDSTGWTDNSLSNRGPQTANFYEAKEGDKVIGNTFTNGHNNKGEPVKIPTRVIQRGDTLYYVGPNGTVYLSQTAEAGVDPTKKQITVDTPLTESSEPGGSTPNNQDTPTRPGEVIKPTEGARDDHMRPGGQPAGEGIGVEKSLDDVKSHGYMGETSAEKTYSYTDAKGNDNTLTFRPNGVVVQTKADGTSYTIYNPANNNGQPWPGFNNLSIENPYAGQPTPGNTSMAANNDNKGPTDAGRDDRSPLTGSPSTTTPTTGTPTTGTTSTETPLTGSGGTADQIANDIDPQNNPITNPLTGSPNTGTPTTGTSTTGTPLTGSQSQNVTIPDYFNDFQGGPGFAGAYPDNKNKGDDKQQAEQPQNSTIVPTQPPTPAVPNPTPTPQSPTTGATDPLQENNPPPPEANPLGGLSADPGQNQNRGHSYF